MYEAWEGDKFKKDKKENSSDKVKKQVYQGNLLCFFFCPRCRNHCRHNGTYILPENDIKGTFCFNKTRKGKCLKNAYRCRGALKNCRHNEADENAGKFTAAGGNKAKEAIACLKVRKGKGHGVHSEKKQTEADEKL